MAVQELHPQPGVNQAPNDESRTTRASLSRLTRALKSHHGTVAGGPASGTRQKPSSGSSATGQTSAKTATEPTSLSDLQQASRGVKDVTAQNGQSVLLHCLVEPNENGELPEVSWFRGTGEPQLLTYETTTIIKDERFLVRQGISRPNDWALQIKALDRNTDAGLYQCQTSGDSPQLQSYQLNIVEPQVSILDSPDLAVRLGGPINLTCVISQSADQLQYVFWYRDSRMINYDLTNEGRGKIVASKVANRQDTISSSLQIFQSRATDSGNYTCAPSGARSTSIYVHVLEATDKRLIMFQNDETNPLAASSQQTNSAISVHVVRLSRARAYAIFATFLIFSSWFQYVAQIQTGISLVLLAIIGIFLSHSTGQLGRTHGRLEHKEEEEEEGEKKKRGKRESRNLKDTNGGLLDTDEDEGRDPLLLERAREALNLLKTLSDHERSSQCWSDELNDNEDEHCERGGFRSHSIGELNERNDKRATIGRRCLPDATEQDSGGGNLYGHLRTASLSRRTHSKQLDKERAGRVPADSHRTGRINQDHQHCHRPGSSSPQASPSGSAAYSPASSSSAGSTGYNSDSRHSCLAGFCVHHQLNQQQQLAASARKTATPNVSLINERDEDDKLEQRHEQQQEAQSRDQLEMVELLRCGRPSALELIIEQLEQTGGGNCTERQGQPNSDVQDNASEPSVLLARDTSESCCHLRDHEHEHQEEEEEEEEDQNTGANNNNNNNSQNSPSANENNKLADDSSEQMYSVPSPTARHRHGTVER